MFLANLFCGNKEEKPVEALETYRQVPREELQEYQFNKSKIRYENGLIDSSLLPSMQMSFLKFRNNKPLDVIQANPENMKQLMYQNSGKVVKKVAKSNYQQLVEKYKRSYEKFYDPDFKPCPESIGKTFARKNCEWKRISEIIPKAEFVCDDIKPEDILQGELGNCYFLSAIAALAQHDFRIKNIFPKLEINKNGLYMARILHHGIYQEVVVDDFIPVDPRGKPIFAKPSGGKEIWVMILEKCWAKLFGSYEAIVGGLPNEVLHAFSGAPTFYHPVSSVKSEQQELFEQLIEAMNNGAIMCCGSKSDPHVQTKGLVLGHAYTLLDVFETPYRMLKIRNPWGERQWNGRASQSDVQFWKKMNPFDIDRLGYSIKNDGIFFMLWEDFAQYFSMVDICRINDNAHYYSQQAEFTDDQARVFEIQTEGGEVVLSLSQKNIRGLDWREKKKGYGTATMVIAKVVGQGSNSDYKYIESGSQHSFSDYSIVLKKLQKGKYMIYASMKWTGAQKDLATISVYTESRVTLREASQVDPKDVLYKTFLDHARNNEENIQVICQKPREWGCSDLLADKCGFGYLAFHVDQKSNRKIGLEIDEREYTNIKAELLAPYKGRGKFKLTAEPGKDLIVMFRMIPGNYGGSFSLPVPRMFMLY